MRSYFFSFVRRGLTFSPSSITGKKQYDWFLSQMSESSDRGAAWRLVMQQVVFARVK